MESDCLFCRMAKGEVPVNRIAGYADVFAIRDINPRAPIHVLIIPTAHIEDARELTAQHADVLGCLFELAAEVAVAEGVADSGYRLAFNVGDHAGMTVHHLHLHLLGGRPLGHEG